MLDCIKAGDKRLFLLLNNHFQNLFVYLMMQFFTQLGSLIFAIILPILFYRSQNALCQNIAVHMVITLIISQLLVHTIKALVNRPRPFMVLEKAITKKPPTSKYSFPSGHSSAAFAMAIVIAYAIPHMAFAAYTTASMVGLSRIYLGAHYPSDALFGYLIAHLSYTININFII